jgi:hypothetical protein
MSQRPESHSHTVDCVPMGWYLGSALDITHAGERSDMLMPGTPHSLQRAPLPSKASVLIKGD